LQKHFSAKECLNTELNKIQEFRTLNNDLQRRFIRLHKTCIRYTTPTTDRNCARWPVHGLWHQFESVIGKQIPVELRRRPVLRRDPRQPNRKMRELDAPLLAMFVTRCSISGD
jgi:hypothetical protein